MSDTTSAVSSGIEVPCGTMAGSTTEDIKRPDGGVCDDTSDPPGLAMTTILEGDVVTGSKSTLQTSAPHHESVETHPASTLDGCPYCDFTTWPS